MPFKSFWQARLRQQHGCSSFQSAFLDGLVRVAGEDHDWDVARAGVIAEPLDRGGTAHVRHREVHDDDIGSCSQRELDGCEAIRRRQDAEAAMAEVLGVHLADMRGVIHDKNDRYAMRTTRAARTIPEQGQG